MLRCRSEPLNPQLGFAGMGVDAVLLCAAVITYSSRGNLTVTIVDLSSYCNEQLQDYPVGFLCSLRTLISLVFNVRSL